MYGGTKKKKMMYGGKKKMQAGGVDKTSERFKEASANTKSRNERLAEEKRLSNVRKSGKDVNYGDRTKMQKGGVKPDYLDMDGDGNKKESMKSAVASKKKMQKGGVKSKKKKMGMGGSKMMKYQAGGFLEPPVYDLDA